MNRGTSLYLDVVRFVAAFIVFMDHYSEQRVSGGLFYELGPFGGEAVDVFFVLSGYVIGYAVDEREPSARIYTINRAARIYSVVVPALVLTYTLDFIGQRLNRDLYFAMVNIRAGNDIWQYVTSLLFINQVWSVNTTPGSLFAYWSLGYEVWYYVIFGVAAFARGFWRNLGVAALLLLAGPNIAALFPLWLLGLFAYRLTSRRLLSHRVCSMLMYGSIAGWLGYHVMSHFTGRLLIPGLGIRQELVQDYIIGLLFAAHLAGVSIIAPRLAGLSPLVAEAIRWVAGTTFSLYLFHQPIMFIMVSALPWRVDSPAARLIVWTGTMLSVFALAQITERRKHVWRALFTRMASPVTQS
jgi:peptidoglycan/LPS O-acetylase OafA/YrhL